MSQYGSGHLYNTVLLQGDFENSFEWDCGATAIKPGYLVDRASDGTLRPHPTRGGQHMREFAIEDAFRGGVIDGTDSLNTAYYVEDDKVRTVIPEKGDKVLAVLHQGENVSRHDWLISYGDGTLCKAASSFLANNVTASSNVTNTNTETAFSTGTVTIPAGTLKVGDTIRIRGYVTTPTTNSTDTLIVKVKIGSAAILTSATVDVANDDVAVFEATLTVRTIGASGTAVASGWIGLGVIGTATERVGALQSTTIDTTGALSITVTATWSVASASNIARLDQLIVEHVKAGTAAAPGVAGGAVVGQADVALDLSLASANDFLPVVLA